MTSAVKTGLIVLVLVVVVFLLLGRGKRMVMGAERKEPIPAPAIADLRADPDNLRAREIIMLRNTRPFNVWGIPTISVPCGFTKSGLPIGLQLASAPWRGIVLLQAAHAYEQATEWHKQRPALANS